MVRKTWYLAYRVSLWHGTMKNETGNLFKKLIHKKSFKNAEHKNNLNVEKGELKSSVNWNHAKLSLNWNKKDSESIKVYTNHTGRIQPIPYNLTNIRQIYDSADILAIKKNWHCWYVLWYTHHQYLLIRAQETLRPHHMTYEKKT